MRTKRFIPDSIVCGRVSAQAPEKVEVEDDGRGERYQHRHSQHEQDAQHDDRCRGADHPALPRFAALPPPHRPDVGTEVRPEKRQAPPREMVGRGECTLSATKLAIIVGIARETRRSRTRATTKASADAKPPTTSADGRVAARNVEVERPVRSEQQEELHGDASHECQHAGGEQVTERTERPAQGPRQLLEEVVDANHRSAPHRKKHAGHGDPRHEQQNQLFGQMMLALNA